MQDFENQEQEKKQPEWLEDIEAEQQKKSKLTIKFEIKPAVRLTASVLLILYGIYGFFEPLHFSFLAALATVIIAVFALLVSFEYEN